MGTEGPWKQEQRGWDGADAGWGGTHSIPCSSLRLTVLPPPMAPLGGTPASGSLRSLGWPAWPLLTMPCLLIQALRLFSLLPPIWVRKGHAEGGGKSRVRAAGVLAAFSTTNAPLRSAGRSLP